MTWHSSVVTFGGRGKDDRVLRLCMFRAGSQDLGGCVAGRLGRKNSLKRSCGAPGRLEHHVRPRPGLSNRSLKQEVPAGRGDRPGGTQLGSLRTFALELREAGTAVGGEWGQRLRGRVLFEAAAPLRCECSWWPGGYPLAGGAQRGRERRGQRLYRN